MPKSQHKFPSKDGVIAYLQEYEEHYKIKIRRSVSVNDVIKTGNGFRLETNEDSYECRVLIAAASTWKKPFIPIVSDSELFECHQLHSAHYKNANDFKGNKVLVVGNGNSGAQILAEISKVTTAV